MKKTTMLRFFMIYAQFAIIANLVHPVTATFLQEIGCPDSMYGIAFSAMAFTNFITCPLWGKLGDKYGYAKIMAFCYVGYSVGQLVFAFASSSFFVVFARALGGIFIGGLSVNSMAYLVTVAKNEQIRAKGLAIYAAMASVGAAIGYLIGGIIGDINIPLVFALQVIGLFLSGVLTYFFLGEVNTSVNNDKIKLKDINPISSALQAFKILTVPMAVFMFIVFLTSFAYYAHDNCFNYYLRAKMNFPPSGNGYFKAAVGIITLVANSTINMWITKKTDTRKSIVVVFGLCSAALFATIVSHTTITFLLTTLLYYTFSVIFLPIQQTLAMSGQTQTSKGMISGLFTSVRSLGMMVGPLFAGLVFSTNADMPFIVAAFAFMIAALLSIINAKQFKKIS